MLGLDPSHRLGSFGRRKIVHTRPHDYCLKNCIGKEYPNWESIGYRQEDLQITAGWAHAGKDGVTMPGRGKSIEREYTKDERQALLAGTKALGISEGETLQRLGETHVRHLPERRCGVEERPGAGVGVLHRRLPSDEEVAELPGVSNPRSGGYAGRGLGSNGDGAAAGRPVFVAASARRELSAGEGERVPVGDIGETHGLKPGCFQSVRPTRAEIPALERSHFGKTTGHVRSRSVRILLTSGQGWLYFKMFHVEHFAILRPPLAPALRPADSA